MARRTRRVGAALQALLQSVLLGAATLLGCRTAPAHRHVSTSRRSATNVSVSESARTPAFTPKVPVELPLPASVAPAAGSTPAGPVPRGTPRGPIPRRIHRHQRQHLQQVVLHDIADRPHAVVEPFSTPEPEVLGHRDLHAVDVVAVPERLEEDVSRIGSTRGSGPAPSRGSGRCGRWSVPGRPR